MSIYKAYDILGQADGELTPELYRSWGRTLGQQLEPKAKFVVGGDVRGSTPPFLAALVEGLCQAGLDVVDLGILPTPMVYYAQRRLQAEGCAIVTASHRPATANGLKWMLGDQPPNEDQVRRLKREAETSRPSPPNRPQTTPRTLDVSFDYVAWLQETWVESRAVQRRVVLDPGHGCWAARARRYLQAVFPHCLFSVIRDTPDAEFGGRTPDCAQADLLHDLSDAVYHERAHLGIAFDGDGDRVVFADDEGTPLTAEEATWVLLQGLGSELEGRPFVCDLRFSNHILETAGGLGAVPVVERPGHAFLHHRMLQTGAKFGAEISGHYFFDALEGGSDALFAACQMIAHLARSDLPPAEVRRMCPPVYITPELRVLIEPECLGGVIEQIRSAWSQYPQTSIDGVRVSFPDGWALVRSSATEPALSLRFEAAGWTGLGELAHRFCQALGDVGNDLWIEYEAVMGAQDHSQLAPNGS